jgi:hypothetical protein
MIILLLITLLEPSKVLGHSCIAQHFHMLGDFIDQMCIELLYHQ